MTNENESSAYVEGAEDELNGENAQNGTSYEYETEEPEENEGEEETDEEADERSNLK